MTGLAWHLCADPRCPDAAIRVRDLRAGASLDATPDALDALATATGPWLHLCDVRASTSLAGALPGHISNRLPVATIDAGPILTRWAVACGCPAGIAAADPVTAARVWSPDPDAPDFPAASLELARWFLDAFRAGDDASALEAA